MQMNSPYIQDILNHAISGSKLIETMTWGQQAQQFIQTQHSVIENYLFYPVINPGKFDGIIVFDKKDFSFAGLFN